MYTTHRINIATTSPNLHNITRTLPQHHLRIATESLTYRHNCRCNGDTMSPQNTWVNRLETSIFYPRPKGPKTQPPSNCIACQSLITLDCSFGRHNLPSLPNANIASHASLARELSHAFHSFGLGAGTITSFLSLLAGRLAFAIRLPLRIPSTLQLSKF